jgi:hypothetical protein
MVIGLKLGFFRAIFVLPLCAILPFDDHATLKANPTLAILKVEGVVGEHAPQGLDNRDGGRPGSVKAKHGFACPFVFQF